MNKYKKLLNNSIIFAIGNLGSKLVQFIMVPLYSYTLTKNQFGITDIITTMVALLSPLLSLEIFDAVFRFAMDKNEDKKQVFSTGLVITMVCSLVILILGIVCNNISIFKKYYILLDAFLLIFTIFNSLLANYVRAIGYSKTFALSGIINTFITVILNIIFLCIIHLGVMGYILSLIGGLAGSNLYLLIMHDIKSHLNVNLYNSRLVKELFAYGLPLIPNSLSWWLNSTSDRLFILAFVGVGANGLYAMASKLPNALTILTNIFSQSWQISAVEEYNSKHAKQFISTVFTVYIYILFSGSILILALIKPFFKLAIDPSYYTAWEVTPFILWSLIYSSVASFLGTIYTASKKTQKILITTVYGAIVNILVSFALVKPLGITGAALANVISFFIVVIIRYYDLNKGKKVFISSKDILLCHSLFLAYILILYNVNSDILSLIIGFAFIILIFLFKRKVLYSYIHTNIKL